MSSASFESGWCKDELKFNKISYRWTIDNFSCRKEDQSSKTFSVGNNEFILWRLEVRPFDCHNGKNYVTISLEVDRSINTKDYIPAKFKFSIIGQKIKEFERRGLVNFHWIYRTPREHYASIERDFVLDEKNGLLPNDTLTVVCELDVLVDTVVTGGQQSPVNINECHLNLSNDLAQLLNSQEFSDCTLSIRGKEIKVHKCILAARSPVFAAMFKHGMKEAQGKRIEISDIEPDVMQELIKFIYTGNAPKLKEMATQLLGAADKYQLDKLKSICENAMYGSITTSNACEMLVVSHLHSANQLKTHAIRCINANANKVVESEGWNEMVKNYPQLIAEVVKAKNSNK